MNIMELGAIGELVGGVAVIASLMFVGIQIRQSNVEAKKRNQLEVATANKVAGRDYRALMLTIAEPQMAGVYRRGVRDFDALTKDERMQLNWWFAGLANHLQDTWFFDPTRLMSSDLERVYVNAFVHLLKMPGGARWWSEMKILWDDAFVRRIDDLVREAASLPALTDQVSFYLDDAAAEARPLQP